MKAKEFKKFLKEREVHYSVDEVIYDPSIDDFVTLDDVKRLRGEANDLMLEDEKNKRVIMNLRMELSNIERWKMYGLSMLIVSVGLLILLIYNVSG